jgi:type IV secretion system protein VirD4
MTRSPEWMQLFGKELPGVLPAFDPAPLLSPSQTGAAGGPAWKAELGKTMPRGWDADAQQRAPFARWAQDQEILCPEWAWSKGQPTLLLGKHDGKLIGRTHDDRHVITVAGTRAGKGRSLILPNLATWPGSVVAIDPKGELARKTARWRREGLGQSVYVLDPYGVSGLGAESYNPLADLDPGADTFLDDVALIADALIIDDPKDRHWTDAAKNLLRALMLYMSAEGGEQTLARLRRLLMGAEGRLTPPDGKDFDPSDQLFIRMVTLDAFDGFLTLLARTFMEKAEREMSSILSTAREQTAFLDSPAMARVLQDSSLRLRAIKRKPTTVYLCLPAARLATHFRWLRVAVNLTLAALEDAYVPPAPVLLLLEEFAVLGHMDSIEKAAGQLAGFGVKLWAVLQDLGQLKAIYKERWETFMGNAGVTTWFGLNDLTSQEYVSNRLGDTHFTRMERVDVTMTQLAQGSSEYRESIVNTKLLSPEEVGRIFARETRRLLVMHPGSRSMVLERLDAGDAMFGGQIDDERG